MKRRTFLQLAGAGFTTAVVAPGQTVAAMVKSPVTTNRLRPPGAVPEEIFPARCIRCGRCVEVCPYRSITMLDIRQGFHAGTPLVEAEKIPCYLCMKCVDVCPTGSLDRVGQAETRMGLAVIDTFTCLAYEGTILCRTCYDKCPFMERAIRLEQLKPVIDGNHCTGCGLCTHACPVTIDGGKKAVNIEPSSARRGADGRR